MKKTVFRNYFTKESKRVITLLLSLTVFFFLQNSAFADNYTDIPQKVIKFANKHHCTDLLPYYKNKAAQFHNRKYDIYRAKYKSKDYNCIILLKNDKSIRFANMSECVCITLNSPIQKVKGTHPIKEWFYVHIFIH